METTRPPGFPGNPPARMPRAPTPARSPPPRPLRRGEMTFRPTHDVGPRTQCISGLNHAAYGLPVNASRPGSPQAHASLGSGWRPTLAGWDWIPTGFRTRFRRSHHGILSPLTGPFPAHAQMPLTSRHGSPRCPCSLPAMRRPDGPEGPGARGPVAATAVLGVARRAIVISGPPIRHRSQRNRPPSPRRPRNRSQPRQSRPSSLAAARRSGHLPDARAKRPRTSDREQGEEEPTISLDFHQQTSLDWHLSIWGGAHATRLRRVRTVNPDPRRVRHL